MARALEQIMQELNSVYDPQRDVYNKQINALPGQQQAQMKGLDAAKTDAFNQIVTGANRRGVAFGGIPLEEQQSYLGSSYLPAVANLKNRFQQNKFTLQGALAELAAKQAADARGIWQWETEQDRLAQEAARARAASSGGGGGGFGLGNLTSGGGGTSSQTGTSDLSLRQIWQQQADAGDYKAQTALNYAGDDGRYDGPVNSSREYRILKELGIQGNYYVPLNTSNPASGIGTSGGGLTVTGGNANIPLSGISANRPLLGF